ncbi:geranyl diphosphate/farnesyl diphosphate synthase [uncultured Gammaproteobacteria bacterium]
MARTAALVEATIETLIPADSRSEAPLWAAMRYGSLGGGKRLRPFLVLEGASLFGLSADQAIRAAAAVELIHCYSLIHDDLPAMDNSELRRGRPTAHRQFNEAVAILAGDGLLTMAFEVLADVRTHPDAVVRCELVAALAKAAGANGMVGGQMIDLVAETTPFEIEETSRLQRLKTGALIEFSAEAGAILGRAAPAERQALVDYARDLGLAFQIADDLLDVEGDAAVIGKPAGRDAAAGKATFVSLLGVDRAREQAQILATRAAAHLDMFGDRAQMLKSVARFVVDRKQ